MEKQRALDEPDATRPPGVAPVTIGSRIRDYLRISTRWMTRAGLAYVLILAVGLLPANNDFRNAQGPDAVDVYFVSSSVHADIIVPLKSEPFGWAHRLRRTQFDGPPIQFSQATHAAIGWGDKGFFIHTETWQDLRASRAAHALLWPSDACMHVTLCYHPDRIPGVHPVRLNREQYLRLCAAMDESFRKREGDYQQIPDASYGATDAFFEAHGVYHCLNTCNSWVGRSMRRGGIRTPWLTPMPHTAYMYLPRPDKP